MEEIISNAPLSKNYGTVTLALIKRLCNSDSTRVREVLENEELGDRENTQFWRHLKKSANSSLTDEFLVELWKTRLPEKTQHVLVAITGKNSDKLTDIEEWKGA